MTRSTHQSGVILIICSGLALMWSAQSQLTHSTDSCGDIICPGSHVLYTCTLPIRGSVIGVWRMKPECEVNIRDITFIRSDNRLNILCDDRRTIEVHGMDTPNGTVFVSTLNVTNITRSQTVECIFDDGSTEESIGNSTVFTTEQNRYPPPDDINVIDIDQYAYTGQLRFNWSLPTENCPSAYYEITHINCGTCPDTTMSSNFTCENVPLENTCNLVVRRVVCGSIKSGPSRSVSVVLKVPRIETIDIVPLYDDETNLLKSISTTFQESESFFVSDGIDGSGSSYTITFTNPCYGLICNRAVIPALQCVNGICIYHLNLSSSNCSAFSEIRVSVFGTNVLGNGTSTNPVTIGYFNRIVRINIRPLTLDVVCTFLNDISHGTREKRCSIVYGPEVNCSGASLSSEGTASAMSNSVRIDLPELPHHPLVGNQLCFIITASDGLNNVSVQGTFNAAADITFVNGSNQQLSLGLTLSLSALLLVAFAGLIILTTVIILLRKTNTKLQHNLRQARSNAVYDVIESPPLPIRSNKNVAYSSVNETIVDKK